jgi:hypothetical protein
VRIITILITTIPKDGDGLVARIENVLPKANPNPKHQSKVICGGESLAHIVQKLHQMVFIPSQNVELTHSLPKKLL